MMPLERMHRAAEIVCALQDRYDAENLRTTSVQFMEENGGCGSPQWEAERRAIMAAIETLRTEAIWSLGKLLDTLRIEVVRQ